MKFMDKKEQVLDIKMTPYGEYLLSQGRFKPEYYSFYDDNILYETLYTNPTNTTAAATATWTFTDKGNEETTITLTDSGGTSVVFEVDQVGDGLADAGSGNTLLGGGSGFANSAAGMAGALISAVNDSALSITATTGGGSTGEVLLTQQIKGTAGNTTITLSNYSNWDGNTDETFPTTFSGGTDLPDEDQNNIEPRIQEDTPQFETQVVFSDRDIFIRRGIDSIVSGLIGGTYEEGGITQELGEGTVTEPSSNSAVSEGVTINADYFERKMYSPQACLGTSDILTTNTPAWSVSMLRGEITGSARAVTGSLTPTIHIPQLDVTLTYKIDVKNSADFISDTELAVQYPNGEYLDVKPEIVLAQIIERNAEFTKENFDIEVFEVQEAKAPGMDDLVEKLRPLKFRKPYSLVQDNVLLDSDEVPISSEPITQEYVEYYFNIKVDNQIDKQLICSSIDELESRGLYVDTEIECEDVKNIALVDIYSTDAVSADCPDDADDPCEDTIY